MKRIVSLLFLAALNGCVLLPIKHNRQITPIVEGTILDAHTNQPLHGANVYIEPLFESEAFQHRKLAQAGTPDGKFRIEPVYEVGYWYYIVLLPLEGTCGVNVIIEHPNYETIVKKGVGYFAGASHDGQCWSKRTVTLDLKLKPTSNVGPDKKI